MIISAKGKKKEKEDILLKLNKRILNSFKEFLENF
jgi:hypothetical protein